MVNNNINGNTATNIYRPLFLDTRTGFPTGIPDNGILNISGVTGPVFTVGGRELLFADGSSTGGGTANALSLQTSYQNSSTSGLPATISLIAGRDLIIDAPNAPGISFKIDATTGAVTIGGDLIVGGTHTYVNSTTYQSDNLRLTAQTPNHPALWIGPDVNQQAPTSDLLVISLVPGDPVSSVFKVSAAGTTTANSLNVLTDLSVGGKINGVNLAALAAQVQSHIFVGTSYKHLAREINIDPGSFLNLPGTVIRSVQTVLEFLDNSINNINAQVQGLHEDVDNLQTQIDGITQEETSSDAGGFTFIPAQPSREWVIEHNKNSKNLMFLVFDDNGFMFQPDSAQIVDANTVIMKFGTLQTGRVNMIFYKN
jgi:hypothetical protein